MCLRLTYVAPYQSCSSLQVQNVSVLISRTLHSGDWISYLLSLITQHGRSQVRPARRAVKKKNQKN